jgi:hypothetical protein
VTHLDEAFAPIRVTADSSRTAANNRTAADSTTADSTAADSSRVVVDNNRIVVDNNRVMLELVCSLILLLSFNEAY